MRDLPSHLHCICHLSIGVMQHTGLLAGEAVADAEILTTVMKDATRRVRPGRRAARWQLQRFLVREHRPSLFLCDRDGSIPSGHAIAAFAVATVIARRYGRHRRVPYAAYGMAAVVGFSRLSLSAHFL